MGVYNCYSAGKIDTNGAQHGRGIGRHDTGSYTVAGCWYLSGSDDDPDSNGYYMGTSRRSSVDVTAASAQDLQSESTLQALNRNGAVFAQDTAGKNGGYPVLWFENGQNNAEHQLTQASAANGTFTVSRTGAVRFGSSVLLAAQPAAGYRLAYFTANGSPILGDYYTVTGDTELAAVFQKVRTASVTVPEYDAFYLAAARTGYKLTKDGGMEYVEREALHTGDTVLEGNIITLQTHSYADAIPADGALEYREGYQFSVSGAEKNADGTYTVTGSGPVVIEAVRATRRKSWLTFADTGWYTGKEKTYTLTTAQQLAGLAKLVNEQGVRFAGVTILLGNDISLASIDGSPGSCTWTAIGSSLQKPFSGTFDGQGHTIFAMEAYNAGSYAALFGCGVDAALKNLTLCGSAVGEARASYAAGLIAYAKGCKLEAVNVYVDVTASGTHAGGVAAYICDGTSVKNCFSYGAVSGISGVGGIVGLCYSASDTITGCANFGPVTGTGSGAYGTGGIVGRLAGVMTQCANYGSVSGADRYTGGIAGYTTARNQTKILACKNEASVSSTNTDARVSTGSVVGNAQNLIWGGCKAKGSSLPLLGRTGKVSEQETKDSCPDHEAKEAPQGAELPDSFTITFRANGETIGTVTGKKGDKSVKTPALPHADGYTAAWPAFTPTGRDMTITAVYRQTLVSGGAVTRSGTYFIPWLASGDIRIAGGLDVTLVGLDSGSGEFDNLTLTVGKGTRLTLQDVRITGDKTLAKSYTAEELKKLAETKADGYGYQSFKKGEQAVVATEFVTLDALLTDADVTFADGDSLSFVCYDGPYTKFNPTYKDITEGKYYFKDGKAEEVPAAIALVWGSGAAADGTVADIAKTAKEASLRFVCGTTEADFTAESAAGKRMPSSVMGLIVVSAAKAEEKPAEEKPAEETKTGFTDVLDTDWFKADVEKAVESKLMTGTSASTFNPKGVTTRAMVVATLYRLAGSPEVTEKAASTDVASGSYYEAAVAWAAKNEIASGTSASTFEPSKAVTREQLAKFLFNYAVYQGMDAVALSENLSSFADHDTVSGYAVPAMQWAVGQGLINGTGGKLLPTGTATRCQFAAILNRFTASQSEKA